MSYILPPGLYAIGSPSPESPVVVTANYKMSYDLVRRSLHGRDVWLLVLETFGINVWCAAGKGTFGTRELVARVRDVDLAKMVSHRTLLLPIMGAPGVSAHEVQRMTGFTIRYATIRVDDLPEYLDNGMVTTPAMKELTFGFRDRLVLVPVELVQSLIPSAAISAVLCLTALLWKGPTAGMMVLTAYLGAMLAGTVAGPVLLPWLPGRSFAVKGALAGLAWCLVFTWLTGHQTWHVTTLASLLLAMPAVSAFHTLNFTGSTPFTSPNGVRKELRIAIPVFACAIVLSCLLIVAGAFL